MRYDRRMTGSPGLNTMNAPKWAAVVSGTVWKRWGVSPSGLLEAEYVRGPLIVWAKPGSGEEEGPQIEAPKPDALALRVLEVNTARQWEKIRAAARGKVRPSVRWKDRRRQVAYFNRALLCSLRHGVALVDLKRMLKRAKGRPFGNERIAIKAEYAYEVASLIGLDEQMPEDLRQKAEDVLSHLIKTGRFPAQTQAIRANLGKRPIWNISHSTWLMVLALYPDLFSIALRLLRQARPTLATTQALLTLQSAAYLGHLQKRVKPAPRRGRIPRPAHAVPRPPTAPLAPPVV